MTTSPRAVSVLPVAHLAVGLVLAALAGCTPPADGVSVPLPVDLAGDWRIVPDDAGRPSECISLRADSVVFYTVACDGVNDLVSAEPVIVDRSTVFIDLTAVDRDGIPGRIQILGTLIDADTIDGQLRILGGVLGLPLEVIEVTLIR